MSKSLSTMKSLSNSGDPVSDRARKLKQDWNDYTDWLAKRGLKGHPSLDKGAGGNNLGIQYVKQYKKENPTSLVSPENIAEIQSHLNNYRDYTINQLRTGKAQISDAKNPTGRPVLPNENLDYYMKDLSRVDGIPGQQTTSWKFPSEFLTTVYKSPTGVIEKKVVENKGLATTPKL